MAGPVHRTVWIALDFDLWGALTLPYPMTEEQWQRLEQHWPLFEAAFVRTSKLADA